MVEPEDEFQKGMEMSLKSRKNKTGQGRIDVDFEEVETLCNNAAKNKEELERIKAQNLQKFSNHKQSDYSSKLNDYSKLDPNLQNLLSDFEKEENAPDAELLPNSISSKHS
jgi:organic radical activating enzyme